MRLLSGLAVVILALCANALHAIPLTYNLSTSGTSPYPGETEVGSGIITIDAVPGSGSILRAFSFTSDFYQNNAFIAEFAYSSPLQLDTVFGGTTAAPTLLSLVFVTASANSSSPSFPFNIYLSGTYMGQNPGTFFTSGVTPYPPEVTAGNLTVVPAGAIGLTPEPSAIIFLGTGLLGLAGVARRRVRSQTASSRMRARMVGMSAGVAGRM